MQRLLHITLFIWIFPVIGLILPVCFARIACAEFYKYSDSAGNVHFVDDFGKIPEVYRNQTNVYKEQYDGFSTDQIEVMQELENRESETEIIIRGNTILVPVKLGWNGKEIETRLILDTGASITTLYEPIARELEIRETQKSKARVAGGHEVEFGLAKVNYIKVGPFEKTDLLVGILPFKGEKIDHGGLLGMNFLQSFSYEIDLDRQLVRWKKKIE